MAPSWRTDSPTPFSSTDEENVTRFLFVLENITARGFEENEKVFKLLECFDGDTFEFSHESFAAYGELDVDALEYLAVKTAFFEKFGTGLVLIET